MNNTDIWKILEIPETTDMMAITAAYRTKLVTVNPEDDAQGFILLREAYEGAMAYAEENQGDNGEKEEAPIEGNNLENFSPEIVDKIREYFELYDDIFKRADPQCFKQYLDDPICNELDTSDDMREALLGNMMDRFMLPDHAWKMLNETFDITGSEAALKEIFPEDYINYLLGRILGEDMIDYSLFVPRDQYMTAYNQIMGDEDPQNIEGRPGLYEPSKFHSEVDSYIRMLGEGMGNLNRLYQYKIEDGRGDVTTDMSKEEKEEIMQAAIEGAKEDLEELLPIHCSMIEHMTSFPVWHPIELVVIMLTMDFLDRHLDALKLAKAIIVDKMIDFLPYKHFYVYSNAIHIIMNDIYDNPDAYTEEEKQNIISYSEELLDQFEEAEGDNVFIFFGKSALMLAKNDYDAANDYILDALDINGRFNMGAAFLKKLSQAVVDDYMPKAEAGELSDKCMVDLGWALFRLDRMDEIIPIIDKVTPSEETRYGWNNLYARVYHSDGEYEKAEGYLSNWSDMLAEMIAKRDRGEEISKKDKGRIKRASYCYYLQGSAYEKLDRPEEAIEKYKQAVDTMVREDKSNQNERLFYMENYGRMLHAAKEYAKAMEVWNEMIEMIDHCVPGYVHRQETAYEMRDAQLVVDDYYNIIRDVPNYAPAYCLAAKVFLNYNQLNDVKIVLDRADEAGIESDRLEQIRARYLAASGKEKEAVDLFLELKNRIEDNKPTDFKDLVEFYSDLAYFMLHHKDEKGNRDKIKEADEAVEKGRKIEPNNRRLLWIKTDVDEILDRHPEDTYDLMLELFPDDDQINYEYGEYYNRQNEEEAAEEQYIVTLNKNPDHKHANNKLMNIYQDRYKRFENIADYYKAVEYANRQLELLDDDYYRIERALLLLDGYELDKAEIDARKAIEMDEENPYSHNCLGLVYMRKGMYIEALEAFQKAMERVKENETSAPFSNSVKVFRQLGEYQDAKQIVEDQMKIFGVTASSKDILMRIYLEMKDFDNAIAVCEELIGYYKSRRKETNNPWYDEDIVRMMLRKVEAWRLAGKEDKAAEALNECFDFLNEKKYLDPKRETTDTGVNRKIDAAIFRKLADHFVNNERKYKDAILYFEKALRFKMPVNQVGAAGPSLTNIMKKGRLPKLVQKPKDIMIAKAVVKKETSFELPKPENYTDTFDELCNLSDLYRFFAGACYCYGLKIWAKALAQRSLYCIEKAYREKGGVDAYLSYPGAAPLRLCDMAMVRFYLGEKEEAFDLLLKSCELNHCTFCNYGVCYDVSLATARIYEMMGEIDKAIEYFRIARKTSKTDCEVYIALRTLDGVVEE